MSMLTGNKIDWYTFHKMISNHNKDRWIYWALCKLDKYGNKILFKYDRCKIKDFFNFNFVRYNREVKTQITCLNTDESYNNKEIISYVYRKFERDMNNKDKEYYYVYFFSDDMFRLANFMSYFCVDIHEEEIKIYYNNILDEDDSISLYQNKNDIESDDDFSFHIKEYFISPESHSKTFTLYDQIKSTSEILEEIFKEALTTKDLLVRNLVMGTKQKAVLYIKNGDGCLYTANNKLVSMRYFTLSDIKKLNDSKNITKIKFHIEDEKGINEMLLSFASKIVLNLIDDEPYVKNNTYCTSDLNCYLPFYLTNKILLNNFLYKKESSLVLIKDEDTLIDARIFIEKRVEDKETKYLLIITNNNNNLLGYYNDEIKDFVDILLYFKYERGIKFKG